MSFIRPIDAATQLRRSIGADETTIPVLSTDAFRVDSRKQIGDEFVMCTGFGVDALGQPVMTGCQRGVSREDSGSEPRPWPGGTPVYEVGWTAVEIVTTIPDPTLGMVGRQFVYQDASGDQYTFNIAANKDGTPYIDWVNKPPEESGGSYVWEFTSRITGISGIRGVALDGSGNIYTFHDSAVARKYSPAFVQQWSQTFSGDVARHVATDGTSVLLSESKTSPTDHLIRKRLATTGAAGSPASFGSLGTGTGQFIGTAGPLGVVTDGTSAWAVDRGGNRVEKFRLSDGVYQSLFDGSSSGLVFNNPTGLMLNGGNLYVLDAGNGRIVVFSAATHAWVTTYTLGSGNGTGQIGTNAESLGIDSAGNFWVADTPNHRLNLYDASGAFLDTLGVLGGLAEQFNTPRQVFVDGSDYVWIADQGNNRLVTVRRVVTSSPTGPTGPAGVTGPTGTQGIAGPQGMPGIPGQDGDIGEMGPVGPQGPAGTQGPAGATGPQGTAGTAGAAGATGGAGATGPTGAQGYPGIPGQDGVDGEPGIPGAVGATGAAGSVGATGPQGSIGATGPTGPQGLQGVTGPTGLQGTVGATGPTGAQGLQGVTGPQGTQGATGAQGNPGIPGQDGEDGEPGIPGSAGAAGAAGSAGPTGAQGPAGPASQALIYAQQTVQAGDTIASSIAATKFASFPTVPANTFDAGEVYRLRASGSWRNNNTTPAADFLFYVDTALTGDGAVSAQDAVSSVRSWSAEILLTVQSVSAGTATIAWEGWASLAVLGKNLNWYDLGSGTFTATVAASHDLRLGFQWGTSNANNTITQQQCVLEQVGAGGPTGPTGPAIAAYEAEVDFGTTPSGARPFTVTNAAILTTSKIIVSQSDATPTGGFGDEAEWDPMHVSAKPGSGSMILAVTPLAGVVTGKYKFHYIVV